MFEFLKYCPKHNKINVLTYFQLQTIIVTPWPALIAVMDADLKNSSTAVPMSQSSEVQTVDPIHHKEQHNVPKVWVMVLLR